MSCYQKLTGQSASSHDLFVSYWKNISIYCHLYFSSDHKFHFFISSCSKIAKLTLARLLMSLDVVMSSGAICKQRTHTKEVLELFNDLIKMDPVHSRYYKDQHSLLLMEQVVSFISVCIIFPGQ